MARTYAAVATTEGELIIRPITRQKGYKKVT